MKIPILESSPAQIVRQLAEQVRAIEGAQRPADQGPVSTGCAALDRLLPGGGLSRGTLAEWLATGEGAGAWTLSIIAAREASLDGGAVVVMDRQRRFYPPAAAALGIDLENLIVIRAEREKDELWALEQALRCEGVAVVWAPLERLDGRSFRRLQLAAESGSSLGLLVRPGWVRGRPSWSSVQLLVEPRPGCKGRRLDVELVRCRGIAGGGMVELEIDEVTGAVREANEDNETHSLHLAARLADPTSHRRSLRA